MADFARSNPILLQKSPWPDGTCRARRFKAAGFAESRWQAARAWVRDRTGQAAFLRDPRAGSSTQVGWRQVKVLPAFSKAARCGAELHGLNRRSRWKKSSGRGARAAGDSPGSGLCGTVLALSARLCQRAAHAFAGRAGKPLEVLCGPWARPRSLACRLGRPLGNVPPGRSGPLKRWTKLLRFSTQLKRGPLVRRPQPAPAP